MNAPHDTETGQPGPYGPEPGESGPRVTRDEVRDLARLRRSRTDRKVSGVAGGIARHLDIDPLLVRVAFVILTFFGGGGLLLYGVAWVLVPEEETGDSVISAPTTACGRRRSSSPGCWPSPPSSATRSAEWTSRGR